MSLPKTEPRFDATAYLVRRVEFASLSLNLDFDELFEDTAEGPVDPLAPDAARNSP